MYQFHDQQALFKVPKICNINFWIENDPPPPLALFQKCIRFGSAILPFRGLMFISFPHHQDFDHQQARRRTRAQSRDLSGKGRTRARRSIRAGTVGWVHNHRHHHHHHHHHCCHHRHQHHLHHHDENQVSIAVAKELYGNVEFSGNLYVDDQNDNDWVGLMFDLFFFFVGDQEYKDWVNLFKGL